MLLASTPIFFLNYRTGIPGDKRPARVWGETGMVYACGIRYRSLMLSGILEPPIFRPRPLFPARLLQLPPKKRAFIIPIL